MKENNDENDRPDIPAQRVGNKLTVEHSVMANAVKDALELFDQSAHRLLHVNDWSRITNSILSSFQLTDSQGREVYREVAIGDLFKINIPGPGPLSGQGFDWVKVEILKRTTNKVVMRVRPVTSPVQEKSEVAHFFGRSATSTFQVFRRGRIVTAAVYGRNEVPNT